MGEPCPAPLRVAMRSPLPFCSVPDRPYKILLEQVGTLCPSPTPRLACPFYLFIYLSLLIIANPVSSSPSGMFARELHSLKKK